MEDIFLKNIILVIGAIFSSIVAGFFALINLISSKEQKVSEFRQIWIDSLRTSLCAYISNLSFLSIQYKFYNEQDSINRKNSVEMAQSMSEIYVKLNNSYNDILFRVNPVENNKEATKINSAFLDSLAKTRDLYKEKKFLDAIEACEKLRDTSIPLLKYEWVKVKNGETIFRFWKRFSVCILILGLIISSLSTMIVYNNLKQVQDIQLTSVELKTPLEKHSNIQLEAFKNLLNFNVE